MMFGAYYIYESFKNKKLEWKHSLGVLIGILLLTSFYTIPFVMESKEVNFGMDFYNDDGSANIIGLQGDQSLSLSQLISYGFGY